METVKTNPEDIVSAGQLLRILDSDAREISALCQRACLKPKKDGFGNIYFSKSDVDVLKKVKELYEHTKRLQEVKAYPLGTLTPVKEAKPKKDSLDKEAEEFLAKKENLPQRVEKIEVSSSSAAIVVKKIETVENNIVSKMGEMLSEKLDGLDEVIVELIKAKTENETLRQKINELNKENFGLKTENSSFKAIGLGLYVKKQSDDFTF